MFAPAEKFVAWFPTTIPTKSFSTMSQLSKIISIIPSSTAFILVWNSRQATPSPISTSVALAFFLTTLFRSFRSGRRMIRGFSSSFT